MSNININAQRPRIVNITPINRVYATPIVQANQLNRNVNVVMNETVTSADGRQFNLQFTTGYREQALQQAREKYGFMDAQKFMQPSAHGVKFGFMDVQGLSKNKFGML